MKDTTDHTLSKVPEVTLIFWIIKITATTTVGLTLPDFADCSLGIR